jgi:energy-coupling factor transporter transmembrane protein EcfT
LLARAARSLKSLGLKAELKIAAAMLGSLLVRSIDTAERINIAMQARGFDRNWRTLFKLQIRTPDYIFALLSASFILAVYLFVKPVLQ